jgi:hypothetical protein
MGTHARTVRLPARNAGSSLSGESGDSPATPRPGGPVEQASGPVSTARRGIATDQTQPVGLGKPATLHAPFAGPDGKRA